MLKLSFNEELGSQLHVCSTGGEEASGFFLGVCRGLSGLCHLIYPNYCDWSTVSRLQPLLDVTDAVQGDFRDVRLS